MGNPAAGWTEDRRQRQREAIQRWKPWSKSTGPKSREGRATVSRNAYSGGEMAKFRETIRALNQAIRKQGDALNQIPRAVGVNMG